MLFDFVQIFLVGVRQRMEQRDQIATGERGGTDRDNLADRLPAALYDESLVAISDAIDDF